MYFPGAAAVEKLRGFPKLRASHDGIVDQKQAPVLDQIVNGDQLHFGDQVAPALQGGHERAGPGGRIFDKRPGIRDTGGIGIADGMRDAGIRNAGHDIGLHAAGVPPRQGAAAVIAHLLHADPLVGGGGIAVVDPEESADLHFLSRRHKRPDALRGHDDDLAGAQIPQG